MASVKSSPVELIPLNLKGAFTSRTISKGNDIDVSRSAALAGFGVPPMPKGFTPSQEAEWNRMFAPDQLAKGRIVPELVVQKGKTHVLRGLSRRADSNVSTSWAGGIVLAQPALRPLASGLALDGYQTTFNNQQHVNFIGTDNHVHEMYFDQNWIHTDLTRVAGAPAAASGSALDGYQTSFNNQQHVNFIGVDNHVHELYYDSSWHHNDLTMVAGAPAAAPGSALDGYETSFNNQQHVNFIGVDNHVHELYYDSSWHHNDLTMVAGAPAAAPGSALDGYETSFNDQQHVNFIGVDNHVHELYYDSIWHHNDLTVLAGAPAVVPGSTLDGYETSFNNQQHVNFIGVDNHVHELYYDSSWHHNDLTKLAGAPAAAPGSDLDGYQTSLNNQQHVNFIGVDNHVHELYYDSIWHHNDLTTLAGAPDVVPGSALDGYQTSFNNQQHVNFIGVDNHVHELYYDSSWHHNDLTKLAGAPAAAPGSALDGYQTSFNNQQHVNFVGADSHVHELYY